MSDPASLNRPEIPRDLGLILLLAAFSALGQFANSIYLPSLPAIALELDAAMAAVQMTLSIFMAGFALSMLIAGPLADRFGRRTVLSTGLGIYLVATLACAGATSVEMLAAARVLQSMGAGAVSVAGRAATRDLYGGADLARAMAAIMIAFAAVPGLAPFVGGVVQETMGWRVSFVIAAAFGVAVWIVAARRLPETIIERIPSIDVTRVFMVYRPVVTSPRYWRPALVGLFIMAALFAFLAGSPEVFIGRLGVSPAEYGIYPAVTILGFVGGGIISRRKAGIWSPETTIRVGAWIAFFGTLVVFGVGHLGWETPITYSFGMFVFVHGMGIAMPAAGAAAIMPFAHIAGTAGGLTGVLQMLGAATGAFLVAALAPLGLHAFPTAMFAAGIGCVLCWHGLRGLRAN